MSTKRIKAGLKIPSSELKPEGRIATLIREDNGPEALVGFMMLLGMDGVDGDLTVQIAGHSIPLTREGIEALFASWMPHCDSRAAVAKLIAFQLLTVSKGRLSMPDFDAYVRTESESTSRVRALRARKRVSDIPASDGEIPLHCNAPCVNSVTESPLQCNTSNTYIVTKAPLQSDNTPQKEKEDKRKIKFTVKEREEISTSLLFASSCSEESVSGWRDEAGCGTAADVEPESSDGVNAEQMSRAKSLVPAGNSTDLLSYDTGGNTGRGGGRFHRLDPREAAMTWPISIDAKLLLQKFAETCPSLEMKDNASPEYMNRLVDDALRSRPLKDIVKVFELAEDSDFLTGRDGKMRNAPVTLDWLLQPANCERILCGELGDLEKQSHQKNKRRQDLAIQFVN